MNVGYMGYGAWLRLALLEKLSGPGSAEYPKGRSGDRGQALRRQTRANHGIASCEQSLE